MFTEMQPTAPAVSADAPTKKFMFERSFDASAAARAPERKPVTLKPEQYDGLKQEAYDSGFGAGRQAGLDEQAEQLMGLLENIGDKIDRMAENMIAIHKENEDKIRRIAMAMTAKFVPDLVSRNGMQEIEALVAGVIGDMVREPRLVVRVHESQFDALNEKINAITAQKAYAGKVVMLADAELSPGDCRVEWADGGIERNTQSLMNTIEKTVTP